MSSLLAYAAVLVIAVATPGPGVLAVISTALAQGSGKALALVAGIVMGDLIFLSLAAGGLALAAAAFGEFFLVIKIAGALYLIWLGVRVWRSTPEHPEGADAVSSPHWTRQALSGLLVALSNPKSIGFYVGILPLVVDVPRLTLLAFCEMAGITVIVVGGVLAVYALVGARARAFVAKPGRRRVFNRMAGTMMIGSGVAIATR